MTFHPSLETRPFAFAGALAAPSVHRSGTNTRTGAAPFALTPLLRSLAAMCVLSATFWGAPHASGASQGVVLVDDRAHTLVLAQPAKRIVSLLPSVTETLCALNACDRLVGVDRYSNWPESIQQLPQLGGLADANIEAIVALKPDLVIMRSRNRALQRLQELGVRVMALDAENHRDVRRHMELVARVVGQPGAGEALWQQVDARVQALRAQVPKAWQGRRVYLELHSGTAAAGANSFIGEVLTQLGFTNVVPASMGLYPKMSPEYVVRVDPDLLITVDSATTRPVHLRPGWGQMTAVREQHVCALPPEAYDVLMRAGPRLDQAAARILQCIQGLQLPAEKAEDLAPAMP